MDKGWQKDGLFGGSAQAALGAMKNPNLNPARRKVLACRKSTQDKKWLGKTISPSHLRGGGE